ncbi:SDR family oxidoreductase [Sphingomonas sp. UYP23]
MANFDRVALVTGANKGIGLEIARQLGQAGVAVIIGARDATKGGRVATDLTTEGIAATYVRINLTDATSIHQAAQTITEKYGRLDILVNNAGIWNVEEDGAPSKTALAVVRETMETNFFGTLAVTQAVLPLLRQSLAGRIVNLSTALGSLATNGDPASPFYSARLIGYNASKAAVNMLTVQLAQELKGSSIVVNAVSPGFVKTDLTRGQGFLTPQDAAKTPVHYALLEDDTVTGRFVSASGEIPW